MAEPRSVVVGETTYNIQPFRAFKGELALTIVSRLTGEVQEVLEHVREFERKWHEDNPLKITRDLCETRIADFQSAAANARELGAKAPEKSEGDRKTVAQFAAEAHFYDSRVQIWQNTLTQIGDKSHIEVPNEEGPPTQELVLAAFPKAWETMPEAVKQVLALVVVSNKDLRQADVEDRWEDHLTQLGKELFYEGEIGQLIELAVVASEVIEAEVANYRAAVGKLRSLYDRLSGKQKQQAKEAKEARTGATSSSQDLPSESSSSPSDSDSPDGVETTSSTEPVGASPSP